MNINELLASTNRVKNRSESDALKKRFGSIFAYNKTVTLAKGGSAIVFNMMIGGATDFIKVGGKKTPVAYHKVSIAINDVDNPLAKLEFTPEQLVQEIRRQKKEYQDEDTWPNADVLKAVEENPGGFFDKEYTIFKTNNGKGYIAVANKISAESEIQVWCSCSDYYWTFQYYNMKEKSKKGYSVNLYGDRGYPSSYVYKSERGKQSRNPLRNPGRNPGVCKHIMLLLAMLMKEDVVHDSNGELVKIYNVDYTKFLKNNERSRVSEGEYRNMVSLYDKDHNILSKQRRESRLSTTVKKTPFNRNKGTFKWEKRGRK